MITDPWILSHNYSDFVAKLIRRSQKIFRINREKIDEIVDVVFLKVEIIGRRISASVHVARRDVRRKIERRPGEFRGRVKACHERYKKPNRGVKEREGESSSVRSAAARGKGGEKG